VEHLQGRRQLGPCAAKRLANVRTLAYLWILFFGLQEQDQSCEVFGDPWIREGGTPEMDEEGLMGGIGVRVAALRRATKTITKTPL
jgi:hypothetical protein